MIGEVFLGIAFALTLLYSGMYLMFESIATPKRNYELVADTSDLPLALLPSVIVIYLLLTLGASPFTYFLGCAVCTLWAYKYLEHRAEFRYQLKNEPWKFLSRRSKT